METRAQRDQNDGAAAAPGGVVRLSTKCTNIETRLLEWHTIRSGDPWPSRSSFSLGRSAESGVMELEACPLMEQAASAQELAFQSTAGTYTSTFWNAMPRRRGKRWPVEAPLSKPSRTSSVVRSATRKSRRTPYVSGTAKRIRPSASICVRRDRTPTGLGELA